MFVSRCKRWRHGSRLLWQCKASVIPLKSITFNDTTFFEHIQIRVNSSSKSLNSNVWLHCSENYESTNYDITVGRQSFYENQALEHERNG